MAMATATAMSGNGLLPTNVQERIQIPLLPEPVRLRMAAEDPVLYEQYYSKYLASVTSPTLISLTQRPVEPRCVLKGDLTCSECPMPEEDLSGAPDYQSAGILMSLYRECQDQEKERCAGEAAITSGLLYSGEGVVAPYELRSSRSKRPQTASHSPTSQNAPPTSRNAPPTSRSGQAEKKRNTASRGVGSKAKGRGKSGSCYPRTSRTRAREIITAGLEDDADTLLEGAIAQA